MSVAREASARCRALRTRLEGGEAARALSALTVLNRAGLAHPGPPHRMFRQLTVLARWGTTLAGTYRSAAARDPDGLAVIDEEGSWTFAELDRRSTRLARALRGRGLLTRLSGRVGLLCRNHHGMIEALIACGKLGADVVLLNTGLGTEQLAAVAEEQRLDLLIADAEFADVPGLRRAGTESFDELIEAGAADELAPPPRPGRTIVLSSGTTGRPKGARRPPRPGLGPLVSILSKLPLRVHDTVLIEAPLFHTWGYAALQIAAALRGTVVLRRRFRPEDTLRAVAEHGCTALFAVPVMAQRLLEVPARPGGLRVVALSGSALPGGLATAFMDAYGDILYNLYGSTEVSWVTIATPAELRAHPDTAGRPPYGTRVSILDEEGEPTETGRIFVANEMPFEGYTSGDVKATHDGMLSTGDVGHLDADGLLYVDGRDDDMIVSGGENVFPREVEDVIARLPQVREVAVVGVPDEEFGQRLAAYVVLRPGERLDAQEVRDGVRERFARFAVPRDVRFLDELPRNATGKVLIRDLH